MDEKAQKQLARASRFIDTADAIAMVDANAAGTRGYMARLLVQVGMPHSKLRENEFTRRNGGTIIHMMAPKQVGLPFGTYPRLLMAWITTEAVQTRSPKLELGDSLADFMHQLGVTATGGRQGTIGRLREHMQRLFCSTVSWTYKQDGTELGMQFSPVEARQLWWDPKSPHQVPFWRSSITLNQRFFSEIIRAPVPVDMRALAALAHDRSPLALDVYTWLTYRLWRLEEPTCIPWASLQMQFGAQYGRWCDFKKAFLVQLERVKALYPEARAFPDKWSDPGLVLEPSPPHVPSRRIRA